MRHAIEISAGTRPRLFPTRDECRLISPLAHNEMLSTAAPQLLRLPHSESIPRLRHLAVPHAPPSGNSHSWQLVWFPLLRAPRVENEAVAPQPHRTLSACHALRDGCDVFDAKTFPAVLYGNEAPMADLWRPSQRVSSDLGAFCRTSLEVKSARASVAVALDQRDAVACAGEHLLKEESDVGPTRTICAAIAAAGACASGAAAFDKLIRHIASLVARDSKAMGTGHGRRVGCRRFKLALELSAAYSAGSPLARS
ncbi:hypothetical protein B0H15DRAFT_944021 [Mycena belliarum]|uniref:Uncharacterized protein n=1 Tax=Mycena belliarum TaxID=1033014 RepID=A0AAD6XST0_9AGAR|nr:hypothetical protein B0H15DRAFT_944021 [Mycena belliae]